MASEKMGIALGMIQTRGLVPAIEASEAMTRASEVRLNGRQLVGGYVTVLVRGKTGTAIRAGRASGRPAPSRRVPCALCAPERLVATREPLSYLERPSPRAHVAGLIREVHHPVTAHFLHDRHATFSLYTRGRGARYHSAFDLIADQAARGQSRCSVVRADWPAHLPPRHGDRLAAKRHARARGRMAHGSRCCLDVFAMHPAPRSSTGEALLLRDRGVLELRTAGAPLPHGRRSGRSLATGAAASHRQLDRKRTAHAAR